MPEKKKPVLPMYGFVNDRRVSNQEYIDSIPDDDPWKVPMQAAMVLLDAIDPDWKIEQFKEKFGAPRLYIRGNARAQELVPYIELACMQAAVQKRRRAR